MEIKLEGYLNPEHNKKIFTLSDSKSIEEIKTIHIKLLDPEFIIKIKNVMNQYKDNNIRFPVRSASEGGLLIKINSKLLKVARELILNHPRKDWFNKKYSLKITVKKYTFSEPKITGIIFKLTELILI